MAARTSKAVIAESPAAEWESLTKLKALQAFLHLVGAFLGDAPVGDEFINMCRCILESVAEQRVHIDTKIGEGILQSRPRLDQFTQAVEINVEISQEPSKVVLATIRKGAKWSLTGLKRLNSFLDAVALLLSEIASGNSFVDLGQCARADP